MENKWRQCLFLAIGTICILTASFIFISPFFRDIYYGHWSLALLSAAFAIGGVWVGFLSSSTRRSLFALVLFLGSILIIIYSFTSYVTTMFVTGSFEEFTEMIPDYQKMTISEILVMKLKGRNLVFIDDVQKAGIDDEDIRFGEELFLDWIDDLENRAKRKSRLGTYFFSYNDRYINLSKEEALRCYELLRSINFSSLGRNSIFWICGINHLNRIFTENGVGMSLKDLYEELFD